ncbi:hypothetical protein [Methanosarcina sp. UBA5]|uniref:hypothetical protein n=1 Tax=Methanosarcina sp. UBA5 TaxID=1915593 RepID=UPI0025FA363A|nr:hypothetical protein [Methanosarcina sp. UBA5]
MENKTLYLKSFSTWAKEIQNQHPKIIEHWLNSSDLYKKAMAKTILEAAEES